MKKITPPPSTCGRQKAKLRVRQTPHYHPYPKTPLNKPFNNYVHARIYWMTYLQDTKAQAHWSKYGQSVLYMLTYGVYTALETKNNQWYRCSQYYASTKLQYPPKSTSRHSYWPKFCPLFQAKVVKFSQKILQNLIVQEWTHGLVPG